jgi:hypothetical protein
MPCKFDPKRPFIYEAVDRIKSFMPKAKIVVNDSNSDDISYHEKLDAYFFFGNYGYETGNIWRTFEEFPNEDYYFFLHDSIWLKDDISKFADKHLTSLAWFPGPFWFEQDEQEWCAKKLESLQWHSDLVGYDPFHFTLDFNGIFGSAFGCSRYVLAMLYTKHVDEIIPRNKMESRAMERLWGMILTQQGYGDMIRENSIYGQVHDIFALENEYFKKHIARRQ